jgi:hypothetical protein
VPPLALALSLTPIHTLPRLFEDVIFVPRLPVGARLPRADHHPLVMAGR